MNTPRVIPHNLDAEQAVLGALMVNNAVWPKVEGRLQGRHFFRDAHRVIFETIKALLAGEGRTDFMVVNAELKRLGKIDDVGGEAYVAGLTDGIPDSLNVDLYANRVIETARMRELAILFTKFTEDAYAQVDTSESLIGRAEESIIRLSREAVPGEFVMSSDWFYETALAVEHARTNRKFVTGVPSGFPQLDRMTRGWQPSELIYIAGRPGTGKTSLLLQLAIAAAKEHMTGIISIEMSRKMLGFRAAAMLSGIDSYKLLTGYMSKDESGIVADALVQLQGLHLAIDDSPEQEPAHLVARVRRFAHQHGLRLLLIDYQQLLRETGKHENRNQEVGAISWRLRGLARELEIPIIVLSQLSRAAETRADKRPQLSDLRESGELEQNANVVLFIHRPHQREQAGHLVDGEQAELILEKQRDGPTGSVRVRWHGRTMRFVEDPEGTGMAAAS